MLVSSVILVTIVKLIAAIPGSAHIDSSIHPRDETYARSRTLFLARLRGEGDDLGDRMIAAEDSEAFARFCLRDKRHERPFLFG
jgi:hypothetical protein